MTDSTLFPWFMEVNTGGGGGVVVVSREGVGLLNDKVGILLAESNRLVDLPPDIVVVLAVPNVGISVNDTTPSISLEDSTIEVELIS